MCTDFLKFLHGLRAIYIYLLILLLILLNDVFFFLTTGLDQHLTRNFFPFRIKAA